jgi:hypothetical protein
MTRNSAHVLCVALWKWDQLPKPTVACDAHMTRMRVMDVLEKGCRISSLNIYTDAVFNIRYL